MLSLSQPTYTQHFLHHERLIRVELRPSKLIVNDDYGSHEISLKFSSYFSTQTDCHGNLASLSVYSERVVHLAHNNPTVLEQWASLLHNCIHKVGFHKDYALLETVGEGGSAKVFLARAESDGRKVVAKSFCKKKLEKKELLALQNQIKILRSLDSKYCPKLIGTYQTQKSYYLVMEYASGMTLKEVVEKHSLDWREKKRILMVVALALQQLHGKQIIHRDIKPENVIYSFKNGEVKIIDFGFSVSLEEGQAIYSNCGTPGYAAPQSFSKDCVPSPSCDVFALGVLAHYLFTGKLPYKSSGRSVLLDARDCRFALSSELKQYPSLLQLLQKMICHQSSRISLPQFLSSSFIVERQQSPNNPEARLWHRKVQNLSTLNTRAQSRCARQRGCSMKAKDPAKTYESPFYRYNLRLITDRF